MERFPHLSKNANRHVGGGGGVGGGGVLCFAVCIVLVVFINECCFYLQNFKIPYIQILHCNLYF